jgi:hypothetical protein
VSPIRSAKVLDDGVCSQPVACSGLSVTASRVTRRVLSTSRSHAYRPSRPSPSTAGVPADVVAFCVGREGRARLAKLALRRQRQRRNLVGLAGEEVSQLREPKTDVEVLETSVLNDREEPAGFGDGGSGGE